MCRRVQREASAIVAFISIGKSQIGFQGHLCLRFKWRYTKDGHLGCRILLNVVSEKNSLNFE